MAARLVADIMRDHEQRLIALTIRPFDDGRFIVIKDGTTVYDKDRTGRFPKYEQDVKPAL
ncbi:MAG: Rdx family protein [Chloroflexota bacterium]|nr:Rdx family protein [Chloroflexota bacterium]